MIFIKPRDDPSDCKQKNAQANNKSIIVARIRSAITSLDQSFCHAFAYPASALKYQVTAQAAGLKKTLNCILPLKMKQNHEAIR